MSTETDFCALFIRLFVANRCCTNRNIPKLSFVQFPVLQFRRRDAISAANCTDRSVPPRCASRMSEQIDGRHMEIVGITTPAVARIVLALYARLFAEAPALCPMFNEESQRTRVQHRALAAGRPGVRRATSAAATATSRRCWQRIAQRHCALGVQPEQYGVVHDHFVGAAAHAARRRVTPVAAAWSAVLRHFAQRADRARERRCTRATAWKRLPRVPHHRGRPSTATSPSRSRWRRSTATRRRSRWTPGQYVTSGVAGTMRPAALHDFVAQQVPDHAQDPSRARRTRSPGGPHDERARREAGRRRRACSTRRTAHSRWTGRARRERADTPLVVCGGRHRHHAGRRAGGRGAPRATQRGRMRMSSTAPQPRCARSSTRCRRRSPCWARAK
jgi:hemoglobin-like flavoprotein